MQMNRYIKAKMFQYQNMIISNNKDDSPNDILDNIPDDFYIIDERKMPDGLFDYLGALHYMMEHARLLGYSDDKIIHVHEKKNSYNIHGKLVGTMEIRGSLCDKTYCEFVKPYKEMGIPKYPYERKNECGDS